jgi:uncharacterized membrane protein YfbV (UPF0208 family)
LFGETALPWPGLQWQTTDLLTTDFCVPKHLECFVTCLENLQLLHEGVSGVKLDPNYDNLIDNFMTSFEVIHKEFGVS